MHRLQESVITEAFMISFSWLALSVTFGATSPKERGLGSPFAQKEKEKFTKKCKIGCVLVQNVVSYKGVQK